MIRAAIFDVDGTLFDNEHRCVHASTIQAIQELRAQGVIIVIATGRAYARLLQGVLDFIPDYVVAFSGHALVDQQGHYLFKRPFTAEEVQTIDHFTELNQLPMTYKTGNLRYANAYLPDKYIEDPQTRSYVIEEIVFDHQKPYLDQEVFFAAGLMDSEACAQIERLLPSMSVYHMTTGWADITHRDIDKAETVGRLLKHLKLKWEDCIAFGDGLNDITFITQAGIGVCMGNGYEAAKAQADYVCDTIDHDGIYKMLKQLTII